MFTRLSLSALLFALFTLNVQADDLDQFLLRPAPGALSRLVTRYQLRVVSSFPAQNLYLVQPTDDDDFLDDARFDPDVQGVERNEELFAPEIKSGSTSPKPEDLDEALGVRSTANFFGRRVWTGFLNQPAVPLIGVPSARTRGTIGSGTVAVIDTGVDAAHPVLQGAVLSGFDFTTGRAGIPSDLASVDAPTAAALTQSTTAFIDTSARAVPINQYAVAALTQSTTAFIDTGKLPSGFGHGTMVAALVRLVAPGARILPIKAFQADGSSDTYNLVRAIYYAADRGAQVVNMSFSMDQPSPEMARAISYAESRGAVLVSSAGNGGNEVMIYPAADPSVIGVASPTLDDQRSGFSNYGPVLVSLAAPGEGIVTAYPGNNYAMVWGTSFSTPLVAGGIALLEQRRPHLTRAAIEAALFQSARPLGSELGSGRLFVGHW